MRSDKLKSPQLPSEFYPDDLLIIKGIRFTPRQIDIIACLISGGTGKTISSLLDIEVKTLEAHKKDIGGRIGGGIQEDIIAFVQRSDKYEFIKQHYLTLFYKSEFEKQLREFAKTVPERSLILKIEPQQIYLNKPSFLNLLLDHLRLSGIKIVSDDKEVDIDTQGSHTLSILTNTTVKQFQKNKSSEQKIFIILDKEVSINIFEEMCEDVSNYIDFRDAKNYFSSFVEILKKIYPGGNLEKLASMLGSEDGYTFKGFGSNFGSSLLKEIMPTKSLSLFQKQKKWFIGSGLILLSVIAISSLQFINQTSIISQEKLIQKDQPIQSELQLPVDEVLLKRSELMNQIDKKLMGKKDIRTVALIGVGGAGKTTLARQYASQQKSHVTWEVNAETNGSLKGSFESLAHALAKTEKQKEILRRLKEIKDPDKREEKLISFVKNHLMGYPNWVLIYDNVENFINIQKYFPWDHGTWGEGRIIITTRDNNIQNNQHINDIIHIGELDQSQKLTLFTKIMSHGNASSINFLYDKKTREFLENIPPFPLDVSVAAYYLKATDISYSQYLKHLTENNENFEVVQKDLLKEAGSYTKTRYSIITLSLKQLVNAHKDFTDLLLLISLIDSQNISRELLDKCKNEIVVDDFIYNLKKYSLVTTKLSSSSPGQTFSIHRNTQSIALDYLVKKLDLKRNPQFLEGISETLEKHLAKLIELEDVSRMRLLIAHCNAFLGHINLVNGAIRESIKGELGCIYIFLGNHIKAKKLLEESLTNLNTNYRFDLIRKAQTLLYLGNFYRTLGDYGKASVFLKESLRIYKGDLSHYPIETARVLAYWGYMYRQQGNYTEAKDMLEQSFSIYEMHLHKNSVGKAWVSSILGNVYLRVGQYKKARDLLEHSLLIFRKNLSENHRWITWNLLLLGNVYRDLGYYEKAKDLFEQTLSIDRRTLPTDHIWYAWDISLLANIYNDLKQHEKAKDLLEESLKIYRKTLSNDHIWVIWASAHLGNVHRDMGNYQKAIKIQQDNLARYEGIYGKDHIETAEISYSLGKTYFMAGQRVNAELFFRRALVIFEKNNHPQRYASLEYLSAIYLKKSEEAKNEKDLHRSLILKNQSIDYLRQAFEVAKSSFPADSPHFIRIQSKLKALNP